MCTDVKTDNVLIHESILFTGNIDREDNACHKRGEDFLHYHHINFRLIETQNSYWCYNDVSG